MSFLKAEWRKLAIANYEVAPEILKPLLPYQTELDYWKGKAYVSLVGFRFLNTRLLGLPIPFHQNFDEVNLRFYVKYKEGNEWKRGVVFVKEIVPKFMISWVANTIYGEHYVTLPMRHQWEISPEQLIVNYEWKFQKQWNRFKVIANSQAIDIKPNTEADFITEHYWGYTRITPQKTSEYELRHPTWEQYQATDYDIQLDFGALYGQVFSSLNTQKPDSVMLAEGSEISVEPKKKV